MQHAIFIVAPIFAMILLGFLAGRLRLVGPGTAKGLADFTFSLAIPAMLFKSTATLHLPDIAVWEIWAGYFGAAFSIWIIATVGTRLVLRRPAQDAPSIAMSASFGNVVMVGLPLVLSLYGPAAAAPAALIVSLHSPLLWLAGTLHRSLITGNGTGFGDVARGLMAELMRNMIILAILAGTLWRLTGLEIHPIPLELLGLLGGAGVPCALVALGLSLTEFQIKGQKMTLSFIMILKLGVMPVVAWVLAHEVLQLSAVTTGVIVVFSVMPTGANAYLFATRTDTAVNSAAAAVALGTAVAIAPVLAIIFLLNYV